MSRGGSDWKEGYHTLTEEVRALKARLEEAEKDAERKKFSSSLSHGKDQVPPVLKKIAELHETVGLETDERYDISVLKEELEHLKEMLEVRWQNGVETDGFVKTYIDRETDDDEVFMECWLEISENQLHGTLPLKTLLGKLKGIAKTLKQAWELDLDEFKEKFASFPLDKFQRFKQSNVADSVKELFEYILPASISRAKAISRKDIERFIADETSAGVLPASVTRSTAVPQRDTENFIDTSDSPYEDLMQVLNDIAKSLMPAPQNESISFLEFKTAMRRVPRVCGHRIQWVQSLNLDKALARHLLPGKVDNGLDGIMKMISSKLESTPELELESTPQLDTALDAFCHDARKIVIARAKQLHKSMISSSAQEANSKFHGFTGDFADLSEFYDGAEETMHLAYPNPETMKGIAVEHTVHPSAEKVFVTGNYFIATCLRVEYFWAKDPNGQDPATLNFLNDYTKEYAAPARSCLYPGENGDQFKEYLVFFSGKASESIDMIKEELKSKRSNLQEELMKIMKKQLGSHENTRNMISMARGIRVMDHDSCVERMKKEGSIIGSETEKADSETIMIGIVFPLAPENKDILKTALTEVQTLVTNCKSRIGKPYLEMNHVGSVRSTTFLYCADPSILSLRKRLAELSDDALREQAENVWMLHDTSLEVKALRDKMIECYVKEKLQSDFETALDIAIVKNRDVKKEQIIPLMDKWGVKVEVQALRDKMIKCYVQK
jgi:hypothetical protein